MREPPLFGTSLGRHVGVFCDNELAGLRELVVIFVQQGRAFDYLHQPLMFPPERRHQLRIAERLRVEQFPLDDRRAGERVGEEIAEAQVAAGLAYFCRKRSTRPAVSISFCLPVKNGWHWAQISRWISCCVERVSNEFPHAQCTFAAA